MTINHADAYSNSTGGTINPEGLGWGCCLGCLGGLGRELVEPALPFLPPVRPLPEPLLELLLLPELARLLLLPPPRG